MKASRKGLFSLNGSMKHRYHKLKDANHDIILAFSITMGLALHLYSRAHPIQYLIFYLF